MISHIYEKRGIAAFDKCFARFDDIRKTPCLRSGSSHREQKAAGLSVFHVFYPPFAVSFDRRYDFVIDVVTGFEQRVRFETARDFALAVHRKKRTVTHVRRRRLHGVAASFDEPKSHRVIIGDDADDVFDAAHDRRVSDPRMHRKERHVFGNQFQNRFEKLR